MAIESSCDETAAAVVENGTQILSNVVVSQVDIFAAYGGVIPEVAARSHLEVILPVVHKALDDAKLTKDDIDAIAVTHTPGLLGSLLIGTLTARVLAILWDKPLYAVHHLKSHIYANWLLPCTTTQPSSSPATRSSSGLSLQAEASSSSPRVDKSSSLSTGCGMVAGEDEYLMLVQGQSVFADVCRERLKEQPAGCEERDTREDGLSNGSLEVNVSKDDTSVPEFPLLALVVSGGHTQIIYMSGHNQFEIIGTTRDDAVGECFDKVAKILGLPYPGGPSIAKAALQGDAKKYKLPHPQVDGLNFSFSGLKTAVLRAVQAECGLPITTPSYELKEHLSEQQKADFAASFQETACEILMEKVKIALRGHQKVKSLVIAGGVSANAVLRQKAVESLQKAFQGKIKVYFPDLEFAGDNAAMVGAAAYFEVVSGVKPTDPYTLSIAPRTAISEN